MEKYIHDLTISRTSVEDAVEPCFKILHWVQRITGHSELQYIDVETIIKASVYLKAMHTIHGDQLVLKLQQHCKFYAADACYTASLQALATDIGPFILRRILETPNGYKHILNVEQIYGQLAKAHGDYKCEPAAVARGHESSSSHCWSSAATEREREQLIELLQRLFQTPATQIDGAIQRILDTIPYSIIAYTFLPLERYMYADLCAIFEQKIGSQLERWEVPLHFWDSMYYHTSHSSSGRALYWRCLQSAAFAKAMMEFFVDYLCSLRPLNEDGEGEEFQCARKEMQQYNFTHLTYLMHVALDETSPCRAALYGRIYESPVDATVTRHLQKLVFVYD